MDKAIMNNITAILIARIPREAGKSWVAGLSGLGEFYYKLLLLITESVNKC